MVDFATPYKPYKAYTPEFNTIQKRLAGNWGNAAQGNMLNRQSQGEQSPLRNWFNQNIGGQTWNMRGAPAANTNAAGTGGINTNASGGVNVPTPQYPYPQIQNPPYYQAPTPANAINYEKAIADAPAEYKDIAKWVADAYRQFLGREADQPGYMAHYARALAERAAGKTVNWDTIMGWLRNSEEGQRYPVMRDVGLQIDPEMQAAKQAYDRWVSENESQKTFLAEQLGQGRQRTQADYGYQMEDLARAVSGEQNTLKNEMIKRGIWQSGITDKNLQDIAQKDMLARGRIGGETSMALGNLERTYGTNLGDLARRAGLYGGQYNDQIANLMQRREGLVSQGLDKQLQQRQEQEWQKKLFEWEQEKFYTNLAAQLANQGGGGYGGGGYGSGSAAAAGPGGWQKIAEQARLIMSQGGNPQDVVKILTQAFMNGRPGLDLAGVSSDDLASWLAYTDQSKNIGTQTLYESEYQPYEGIAQGLANRANPPTWQHPWLNF